MKLLYQLPARAWASGAWAILFFLLLAVACIVGDLIAGRPPVWAWIVLPASGLFLWTLVEYILHSQFFHDPPRGFRWLAASHDSHHQAPDDPERIVAELSFSLPFAALLFGMLSLLLWSISWAALVFVGLVAGYLAYEGVHYSIHRSPLVRRWLRPLASHHMHHHYADPTRCFGVTTPLWDWVFRTGRQDVASRLASTKGNQVR